MTKQEEKRKDIGRKTGKKKESGSKSAFFCLNMARNEI